MLHSPPAPGLPSKLLLIGLVLWTARLVWLAHQYAFDVGGVRRHHVETAFVVLILVSVVFCLTRSSPATAGESATEGMSAGRWLAITLGAVTLSLMLFAPALRLGLLSDDFVLLEKAAEQALALSGWYARPWPLLAWRTLAHFSPDPASGMHALNVVLHGLNAALVVLLARRLALAMASALVAGGLFLSYPAGVEAVAWCSGLQDVLMTTGVLAFVLTLASSRALGPRITCALPWLVLALGAKETAIAAPLLWLVAFGDPRGRKSRETWIVAMTTGACVAVYSLWRLAGEQTISGFARLPDKYLLQGLILRPFAVLGAPWSEALLEVSPWPLAASTAACGLLVFANAARRLRAPGALRRMVGMSAWVVIAGVPVYRYFFVSPDLQGSRYTYLGEAGWAILLAELVVGAAGLVGRQRALMTLFAVMAIGGSVLALRFHLRAWEEAAEQRDRVLLAALRALDANTCRSVAFEGVPDTWCGAYVFRNGFAEALRRTYPERTASLLSHDRAECRFVLRLGSFERAEEPIASPGP